MPEYSLKKMTPHKTKDWYIKWGASLVLIVGIILTSNNIYPLNLYFDIVGLTGWFIVGMIWNDCLLYTSPSPRDGLLSRMPSSA